jgi:thiamine-phosphate pyrophosphorylase
MWLRRGLRLVSTKLSAHPRYGDLQRANAAAAGASYIAFGGFYPSRIKKYDFRTSTISSARQISFATGGDWRYDAGKLQAAGTAWQ